MKFRQNEIFFWESQIACSVGLILCCVMYVIEISLWPIILPLSLGMLGLLLSGFLTKQEIISMDQEGLSCSLGNKLMWSFPWSDIDALKLGHQLGNLAVIIYLKPGVDMQGEENRHNLYFQLSFRSQKALKCYYKWPLPKIK